MEGAKPRLMIQKVILENFKSYAGIKEIGPFHKCFTAVVGPNGNGKSNLLECLLFAFGKRAAKMRLKRLSELIHRSALHPNLTYAKVSVFFQDIIDRDDDFEVVAGSELVLSRQVNSNSNSTYRLNGLEASYEQVVTTLKERGIDLEHNRFLILQGEVEQIALLKPRGDEHNTGLLEYLEEIIGTNKYVDRIELAEKNLDDIAEKVAEKQHITNESEKQLKELEGPKEEAIKYIKLEQEGFCLRNVSMSIKRHDWDKKSIRKQEKIDVIEAEMEETKKEHQQKLDENEEQVQAYANAKKEKRDAELETQAAHKRYTAHEIEANSLQQKITYEKKEQAKNETNISKYEKDLQKHTQAAAKYEKEVPELEANLQELDSRKQELDEQFYKLHGEVSEKTTELQSKKDAAVSEQSRAFALVSENKNKLNVSVTKRELGEKNRKKYEAEMAEIEHSYQEYQATLAERRKSAEDHQNQANSIKQEQKNLERNAAEVQKEVNYVDDQIRHLTRTLQDLNERQSKQQNKNTLQMEVMKAVNKGELTGIVGRLGDLGTIDAKYDIAVSSASPKLDFFVSRTIKEAEELLEFSRQRKLGKISVICLDKVSGLESRMNTPGRIPDNSKRLLDLIQPKSPEFMTAFYQAVMDTLVVDNLNLARRCAFEQQKRWRVVTLNGELCNPSGEMSGNAQPLRGRMKLNGQADTSNIEADKHRLDNELTELRNNKRRVMERLSQITQEKVGTERQLNEAKKRTQLAHDEAENMQKKINDLDNARSDGSNLITDEEISDMMKIEAELQKALDKVQMLYEAKSAKIAEIERDIEQIGGEEYKIVKQTRAQTNKALDDKQKEINQAKKAQATAVGNVKRIGEKIEECKQAVETHAKTIEDLSQAADDAVNAMAKAADEFDQNQEIEKEKQAIFEQANTDLNVVKAAVAEIAARYKQQDEKCKRKKEQLGKVTKMIKDMQDKIDSNRAQYLEMMQMYRGFLGDDFEREIEDLKTQAAQPEAQQPAAEDALDVNPQEGEQEEVKENVMPPENNEDDDDVEFVHRRLVSNVRTEFNFPYNYDFAFEELDEIEVRLQEFEYALVVLDEELKVEKPNLNILKEYRNRLNDFNAKNDVLATEKAAQDNLRGEFMDLKKLRHDEFVKGFTVIGTKLREMYQLITRGGDAELEFADSLDPFTEGIVFTVRPPLKSWKKMANLSGGEKTIASLALVFALHHYKPTALYVMDEIDAALDYQNVSIIANYIKSRTKNTQFIIVSLRSQNFELADKLVGVYKVNDVSSCLIINPIALLNSNSKNPIIKQTVNNIKKV